MRMTAKQWLNRGRRIDQEIAKLEESRRLIEERLTSITQSYSGDGAQTSKDPHKFDRLAEINSQISERTDELIRVKAEILETINRLSDQRQRMVLLSYYIDGKTWEQTAVDLSYSWRQVMRIHGHALKEIELTVKMS